jgi:hypothetical protein
MGDAQEESDQLREMAVSLGLRIEDRDVPGASGERWTVIVGKGELAHMDRLEIDVVAPDTLTITHDTIQEQTPITAQKAVRLMTKAASSR